MFDCSEFNEEKKGHDLRQANPLPAISFIMGTATQNLGSTISDQMWGLASWPVVMVFTARRKPSWTTCSPRWTPAKARKALEDGSPTGRLERPMGLGTASPGHDGARRSQRDTAPVRESLPCTAPVGGWNPASCP